MSTPKMRTLPETIAELKQIDNNTALTLTALRRLVNNGSIPCVLVGSKRLVNVDTVYSYLCGNISAEPEQKYGKIRDIV